MIHKLKILPEYFNLVEKNKKRFELRRNDRKYQEDDILLLSEYVDGAYTGRQVVVKVTNIFGGNNEMSLWAELERLLSTVNMLFCLFKKLMCQLKYSWNWNTRSNRCIKNMVLRMLRLLLNLKIIEVMMTEVRQMMENKLFEKTFDAWNLASVAARVWGPESNIAQKAQKDFYRLLMAMDDQTKLDFFEYLEKVKVRLDSWG
jgi:hypothetical protein